MSTATEKPDVVAGPVLAEVKEPPPYTAAEVAAILRIGQQSVYDLCSKQELGHNRFGGRIRIPRAALEAYIKRTTVEPRPKSEA